MVCLSKPPNEQITNSLLDVSDKDAGPADSTGAAGTDSDIGSGSGDNMSDNDDRIVAVSSRGNGAQSSRTAITIEDLDSDDDGSASDSNDGTSGTEEIMYEEAGIVGGNNVGSSSGEE